MLMLYVKLWPDKVWRWAQISINGLGLYDMNQFSYPKYRHCWAYRPVIIDISDCQCLCLLSCEQSVPEKNFAASACCIYNMCKHFQTSQVLLFVYKTSCC